MHVLQITSLNTTLHERREEFQGLQTAVAEKESSYRELATDMGMDSSEVAANIKKALALPQTAKHLNDIYNARKDMQSVEESIQQMAQKLDKLRDADVARQQRLSLVQTQQAELAQQVNILELTHAKKLTCHTYPDVKLHLRRTVHTHTHTHTHTCTHTWMHNNTQHVSICS